MTLSLARLVKALIRRTALDDLGVSMAVASAGVRLLRLTAQSPEERRLAGSIVAVLDEARLVIRELRARPDPVLDIGEDDGYV